MISLPSGTRIWLVAGATDIVHVVSSEVMVQRKGMCCIFLSDCLELSVRVGINYIN